MEVGCVSESAVYVFDNIWMIIKVVQQELEWTKGSMLLYT